MYMRMKIHYGDVCDPPAPTIAGTHFSHSILNFKKKIKECQRYKYFFKIQNWVRRMGPGNRQ